jgi:hypothetical protein
MMGMALQLLVFDYALLYYGATTNTRYSEDYSWRTFSAIHVGADVATALSELGPPIDIKNCPGHDYYQEWHYTSPKEHLSWLRRILVVDKRTGRIVKRITETYWD